MSSSDSEKEYEVEKILEKKGAGTKMKYKIKWIGYKKPTWELASNCSCTELIKAFEREHNGDDQNNDGRKRNRTTASKTVRVSGSSTSSDDSPSIKKRKLSESPKTRHQQKKTPPSRNLVSDDSSESEPFARNSLRNTPKKRAEKLPATPGRTQTSATTPKSASQRRKSDRVLTRLSSTSDSTPPTSPKTVGRTSSAKKSPKGAQKAPATKSSRLSDFDNLHFKISRIDSAVDINGTKKLIVTTTDRRTKTVDIKAAAKQNCDLVLDFLIARIP